MEQNQNEPRTISPGLLTTLIVVILAAAGFFGWNYLQKQKVVTPVVAPSIPTKVTSLVTPSTTPTTASSISTADWKTYTNTKDGYSFKYPSKYFLNTDKIIDGDIYIIDTEKLVIQSDGAILSKYKINIDKNIEGQSIEEVSAKLYELRKTALEKIGGDQNSLKKSNLNIDGKNAIIVTMNNAGFVGDTTVYIEFGKEIIQITGDWNNEFQTILSTFQFTK